jgi:hypothetical protein
MTKTKWIGFFRMIPGGIFNPILIFSACPKLRMKPSHMPEDARGFNGCEVFDQPLKSPMTLTFWAEGAQTAK